VCWPRARRAHAWSRSSSQSANRGTPAREAGRAKPADRNRPAQL
jgi:hypothetical protein